MIRKRLYELFFVGVLFCVSCTDDTKDLLMEEALFIAGANKPQLDRVLSHYADDPMKLEAARFLIRNMPGHYSYTDTALISLYYRYVDTLITNYRTMPVPAMSSVMNSTANRLELDSIGRVQDIKIITADFLIRNIEEAFTCWNETPWAQHLSFDEFCEYILPYKTSELQPIAPWRDLFSYYNKKYLSDFKYCDELSHSS